MGRGEEKGGEEGRGEERERGKKRGEEGLERQNMIRGDKRG